MCGIAGAWTPGPGDRDVLHALGAAMGTAIAHRGPDDAGTWVDPGAGLVLSHRRLSILDLSPQGHQPMASADGRGQLSFNGEVYNHAALRAELAALGHGFRGRSDTEVLLAAIAQWGVDAALARANGMFAFAAWDAQADEWTYATSGVGDIQLGARDAIALVYSVGRDKGLPPLMSPEKARWLELPNGWEGRVPAADMDGDGSGSPVAVYAGGALLLVLVGAATVLALRRRARR